MWAWLCILKAVLEVLHEFVEVKLLSEYIYMYQAMFKIATSIKLSHKKSFWHWHVTAIPRSLDRHSWRYRFCAIPRLRIGLRSRTPKLLIVEFSVLNRDSVYIFLIWKYFHNEFRHCKMWKICKPLSCLKPRKTFNQIDILLFVNGLSLHATDIWKRFIHLNNVHMYFYVPRKNCSISKSCT